MTESADERRAAATVDMIIGAVPGTRRLADLVSLAAIFTFFTWYLSFGAASGRVYGGVLGAAGVAIFLRAMLARRSGSVSRVQLSEEGRVRIEHRSGARDELPIEALTIALTRPPYGGRLALYDGGGRVLDIIPPHRFGDAEALALLIARAEGVELVEHTLADLLKRLPATQSDRDGKWEGGIERAREHDEERRRRHAELLAELEASKDERG